jgi:hypothetical protein
MWKIYLSSKYKFTDLQIATGHFVMYISSKVKRKRVFFATDMQIGYFKVNILCIVLSICKLVYWLKEITA